MLLPPAMALTSSLFSQGKPQARPQLDESFRGTGTIRAGTPAFLQARSNINAMLVVLKVARQSVTTPPLSGRFGKRAAPVDYSSSGAENTHKRRKSLFRIHYNMYGNTFAFIIIK